MAVALLILVAVSLHAIADATQLTFSKYKHNIYVETDETHYAMYGPVTDKETGAIRIITMSPLGKYYLTSDCDSHWTDLKDIKDDLLESYQKTRVNYLKEKRGAAVSPQSYVWSDTYSSDKREFSAIKVDSRTTVYSSNVFPSELARVIVSGNVIIFAHYDGTLTMKTRNCLYRNEKILLAGIEKMDPDSQKTIFSSTGEKALRKHLKSNPISETAFDNEQSYMKTYTTEENIAATRAMRGGGVASFDGKWFKP